MEDGDHGDDQSKAETGSNIVPVGTDEEHHATGQQDGSENQRNDPKPAQTGGAFQIEFEGADAVRGLRIQDAGLLPAV